MTASSLFISSTGLAEDCARVEEGAQQSSRPVESKELLKHLQAFAAIPSLDLLDVEAFITVHAGAAGEFVIRNEGGVLFLVEVPTMENSPLQRSPEEIVQFLDATFSPSEEEEIEIVVEPPKVRRFADSPVLLALLLVTWGVVAYLILRDPGPEGVDIVKDPGRIQTYFEQMEGRYGTDQADGDALYLVEADSFKVFEISEEGVSQEPVADLRYEFGQRAGRIVLVLETGVVLDRNAQGDLVFGDELYPRL
jgi:hypothetical protein